jgi:hypothetical protein
VADGFVACAEFDKNLIFSAQKQKIQLLRPVD